MEWCAQREDEYIAENQNSALVEGGVISGAPYTFACEEHDKSPKVQAKIASKDRVWYAGYCRASGLACHDYLNGDVEQKGYHCYTVYRNINTPRQKIVRDTCGIAAILMRTKQGS